MLTRTLRPKSIIHTTQVSAYKVPLWPLESLSLYQVSSAYIHIHVSSIYVYIIDTRIHLHSYLDICIHVYIYICRYVCMNVYKCRYAYVTYTFGDMYI